MGSTVPIQARSAHPHGFGSHGNHRDFPHVAKRLARGGRAGMRDPLRGKIPEPAPVAGPRGWLRPLARGLFPALGPSSAALGAAALR